MATVLVTGGNRGIGLQLVTRLVGRGDTVIAVCREPGADLDASGAEILPGIDVADAASMARLKAAVKGRHLDVVINNAGILRRDGRLGSMDYDAMLEQYRVNALGPLRVCEALLDNLAPGSKIAIVSSRVGSIADNGSGGNYGYRASKAAVNQIGTNLKIELEAREIAVALLHPGYVATDMTGNQGMDPSESARGLIERIDALNMSSTGKFWHAEGYELPW